MEKLEARDVHFTLAANPEWRLRPREKFRWELFLLRRKQLLCEIRGKTVLRAEVNSI